jgi:hypothetical protein
MLLNAFYWPRARAENGAAVVASKSPVMIFPTGTHLTLIPHLVDASHDSGDFLAVPQLWH